MSETTAIEKVTYGVFEDMTKNEMIDHLIEAHRIGNVGGVTLVPGTKVTRAAMTRLHTHLHIALDSANRRPAAGRQFYFKGEYIDTVEAPHPEGGQGLYRAPAPAIEHIHGTPELEVSEDTAKHLAAIMSGERSNTPVAAKPLPIQERKVLKELVDNDFAALKSEMKAWSADMWTSKRAEIEASWESRVAKGPAHLEKAVELHRRQTEAVEALKEKQRIEMQALVQKHEDQRTAFDEKAGKDGIVIKRDSRSAPVKADAQGRAEELASAEAENTAALERALMTLERQRLTAQRQVLVSGVSRDAAKILDEVPEARSLMVEAQKQQQEITA